MAQVDEFVAHDRFISSKMSSSSVSTTGTTPPPSPTRESPPSSPASSIGSLTFVTLSSTSSTVPAVPPQPKCVIASKNCSIPLIARNGVLLQTKPRRSVTVMTRLPTAMVIVSQEQKAVE